jgi:FkbM family methyltransferase
MNYEYCYPYVDASKVKSIFELGSRDCKDAVSLAARYQCPVIAFECNKMVIDLCRETIEKSNSPYPITLVDKAVHTTNGSIPFWAVDETLFKGDIFHGDILTTVGTSSTLEHNHSGWNDFTIKTDVPCIRLDSYLDEAGLPTPELICMDLQGAELTAIRSLGDKLEDVRYIATEMTFEPNYKGATYFKEFNEFMLNHGFEITYIPFAMRHVVDILNGKDTPVGDFDMVYSK